MNLVSSGKGPSSSALDAGVRGVGGKVDESVSGKLVVVLNLDGWSGVEGTEVLLEPKTSFIRWGAFGAGAVGVVAGAADVVGWDGSGVGVGIAVLELRGWGPRTT